MNVIKYKNQRMIQIVVIVVFTVSMIISYCLNPEFFQKISYLIFHGDIKGSIKFIRSYGAYAMLVSFLLIVFINTVAVLPNIFILAANGVIFGVVKGTLISWLAESTGVIFSFILMRYLFHDFAQSVIVHSNALKRIDKFSGQQGFQVMFLARCIPYVPSGLITALGAVSSISLADYIMATFLGKLPSAWVEVTLGHDLLSSHEHLVRLTILLIFSGAVYCFIARRKRRDVE